LATLLGFLFSRERQSFPLSAVTGTYLLFLLWMTITSFFALDSDTGAIFDRWVFVLKMHLFLFPDPDADSRA
jgi:putative inorganic carbon (HCO3(-)) transporter